jgi:hypothetical protein
VDGTWILTRTLELRFKRKESCGITLNKMLQPGTERCREEMKELVRN